MVTKMLSRATSSPTRYRVACRKMFCAVGSAAVITTRSSTGPSRPSALPTSHATTGMTPSLRMDARTTDGQELSCQSTDGATVLLGRGDGHRLLVQGREDLSREGVGHPRGDPDAIWVLTPSGPRAAIPAGVPVAASRRRALRRRKLLTQQAFQARVDVEESVVQAVGEPGGLLREVGVAPGQDAEFYCGLFLGSNPPQSVGKVRAASAMTWASWASVLVSPG